LILQKPFLVISGGFFDIDKIEKEVSDLEQQTSHPNFWDQPDKAQQILKTLNSKKDQLQEWKNCFKAVEDARLMLDMAVEENDQDTLTELDKETEQIEEQAKELELKGLLSSPEDTKNAILTIHPGAGGTESHDWAQMLMRLYSRWCDRKGYKHEILDMLYGEEAGIKSVTIEITGAYAYGYLKSESGVHRLVRISPFDASGRRHTSFASIFVLPEIDEDIEIEIDPNDLRIDTFRASGAGGQHVNRTDSAVRITHIPTGIVVSCQNERSQHKNKANAMKILKARLYQKKLEEEKAKRQRLEDSKAEIAWGNQIRSYVFHPYNMVKDHRTEHETGNVQRVMDGEIDDFIYEFLLQSPELQKT
jgi:peptide chain release factor 2